jgi:deoxyguanosine kinase
MELQATVYISIGTNLGDKKQNITECIKAIHLSIATVVSVSGLYESPSWGFEAPDFYNCVVKLHSQKSATKLLKQFQKLERDFGREKTVTDTYSSRIIDIDIISYNSEVLDTEALVLPHPQLQHRNFVLEPLQEIAPEWVHPILHESVTALLQKCTDDSAIKVVANIDKPLQKYPFEQLNYLVIEGNIGAGKTTLATKIAEDFNAKQILERFADNPFLPKFYKDQNRYAFPLEMSFLADRYQQLTDDLAQFDLFKDFVVADYHIFKSQIFAKVTLQEDEFRLYKTMFDIIHKEMPKPELYVYLYQNTERLLQNIKKRGRNYEQQIPAEYLEQINKGYLDFIKVQKSIKVLIIDVSELDFVKRQEDYIYILNLIKKKLEVMI